MQQRLKKIKSLLSIVLTFICISVPLLNAKANIKSTIVRVIVEIEGQSTLEIAKCGDISRNKALKYSDKVKENQQSTINNIKKLGGKVRHTFQNVINGISVDINKNQIDELKKLSKVKNVTIVKEYYPLLNTSKDLINVKSVIDKFSLRGEGTVVSVIDTGIDYTHKDMRIKNLSKIKIKKDDIKEGPGKWYSDKIPYGYNFADDNYQIIDKTISMHGMHVAGIIGANGDENNLNSNNSVIGVAPETQLLAMKVFSNKPGNEVAFSDDITAAIEDSVKKGADVINMSLGENAGFVDDNDPEQKAIKAAVDAGVIVVVAAGNASYATNPDSPYMEDIDTGNVSSPGVFKDSLQVASMNNAKMVCKALEFKTISEKGQIPYCISEMDPAQILKGEFQIVNCGFGKEEDFKNKNLKGKVALMNKGHTDYIYKKLNAQNAGAIGAIVYNSEEDDSYISMPTDSKVKIPCIFINNSDGQKLKDLISKDVKVIFNNAEVQISNSKKDMSGFSSWGCTPDLSFKPEVTAPGGGIYSTINNNRYESKSGTSMASPHTAGAMALLVQNLRVNKNLKDKDRNFVNLAKNLIVNTAEPLLDKKANNLPYLTRQQGAGLIQIDKALESNVILTDNSDRAVIELKEIENNKTFELKLKNLKDKDICFKVSDKFGVLTNQIYYSDNFKRNCLRMRAERIQGANISFDKREVVVPAKGEVVINVNLSIPATTMPDIFIEGFITLESKESSQCDIGIPYMGFFGKWNRARIFDAPMWSEDSFYNLTALLDSHGRCLGGYFNEKEQKEDVKSEYISMSPNKDKIFDEVFPHIAFLRNAKEFNIEILDHNKNVVRQIAHETNIRKNNGINIYAAFSKDWKWDGYLYNKNTGKMEVAKEGQYYIRASGKIDFPKASYQYLDIPIKIDLTAPDMHCKIEKIGIDKYRINFNGIDNVAIKKYFIYFDNYEDPKYEFNGDNNVVEIQGVEKASKVIIKAEDFAGNTTCKHIVDKKMISGLNIPKYINKKDFTINYNILDNVDNVEIYIDDNKINNGKNTSYTFEKLDEGKHELKLNAYDKEGNLIDEEKINFIIKSQLPIIDLINPVKDIEEVIDGQEKYLLKFSVKEDSAYTIFINDKKVFNEKESTSKEKNFEYNLSLKSGENKVSIKVEDIAGNIVEKKFILNSMDDSIIKINNLKSDDTILGKELHLSGRVELSKKIVGLKVNDNDVKIDALGNFKYNFKFDSYGNHRIVFECTDSTGKSYKKILKVNVSAIKFKNKNYNIKGQNINIPYKLDEDNPNIKAIDITVDNIRKFKNSKEKNSINIDRLFEGKHTVVFNVLDNNEKIILSRTVLVNVDNIGPSIGMIKSEDGKDLNNNPIFNKENIRLLGEINEDIDYLRINGESIKIISENDVFKFNTKIKLREGLNLIRFEMQDKVGNRTEYVNKVYLDTKAPILKIKPNEEKIILKNEKEVSLNIIAEDDTFGFKLYVNDSLIDKVIDESGSGKNIKKEVNYKVKVPGDKSIVKIKLVDYAGNITEKTIKFYREANKNKDFIINNITINKELKNGQSAKVKIDVTNNTEKFKEITLVLALYDINKKSMVKYTYINKGIDAKNSEGMEVGFYVPNEGQYLIKGMIWDNILNMNPLTEVINVKEK